MRLTRATQPIGIAAMDAKRAIRGERKTNSVTVTSTADTPDVGYPAAAMTSTILEESEPLSVRAMLVNV